MAYRRKPKSEPVDPRPVMPRSDEPFEEKLIEKEFELHFARISKMEFESLKATHEYSFRQGYFTGKIRTNREQENSPTSQ